MSDTSMLLTVVGTPGDDYLIGTNGNDLLDGGDGFDHLLGLAGDDTLIGGTGSDQLDGGSGNDTYMFAIGDGFDAIREGALSPDAGGMDTVMLLAGYDPATTQLYRYGNDLMIRSPGGDEIHVQEHFGSYLDGSLRSAIEQIVFADGTIWDAAAIVNRVASNNSNLPTEGNDTIGGTPWGDYIDAMDGNDTLSGGDGDDFLVGGSGDDRIFGGAGNDFVGGKDGDDVLAGGAGVDKLEGGAGNDTYLFNLGDGQDRISEFPLLGESNRVVFGNGIAFADLHAYADYGVGGVVIDVGTGGDRMELSGAVLDPYSSPRVIDSFRFADGTVATADAVFGYGSYQQGSEFGDWLVGTWYADSLYGNGGDDQLYGDSGNDILAGGQGHDLLSGGAGDDTYFFNRGDGWDYIEDTAFAPFEGNRVVFGYGITIEDLHLHNGGGMPFLEIAGTPGLPVDGLQFSALNPLDPMAPRSVETFEFADGTTLSVEQLIARGFYVGGTEWGDYLIGSPYNDRIYGYGGDDWLQGLEGNDVLIGGTGFDQLDGGLGNDTYVFAAGDGFDMIWEGSGTPEAGGSDTVQLLDGYDPATTELYRYGNDLAIRNGTTGEQVIVREQFGGDFDGSRRAAIEQIMFADGTTWDAAAISARIATMNSNWTTAGSDTVGGTPLDDFLFSYGGNDVLSGGAGNDILDGAAGNDRLFGGAGDDRLWDMGGGNDLLAGGTGNDLLNGGAGNDTYRFNLGDGVDQIEEMPAPGETNRVVFGDGIGFHDLRAGYDTGTGQAVIDIGSNGDQLRIANGYPDPYAPHAIDTFTFADGTVASFDALFGYAIYFAGSQFDDSFSGTGRSDGLYGNSGNDWLYGYHGNDFIGGGQGNDWLNGGAGNDTYQFNRGDGLDTIEDFVAPGESNRVLFGAGITLDDLRLRFGGPESLLEVGSNGDALRLLGFSAFDPSVPYPIELFEFADGSTITAEELIARGFHVEGSDYWGEYLPGSEYNDRIFGLGFDDRLFGYAGDDTLVGGIHNDQLDGGTGNDTYVFYSGDGYDTIWEGSSGPDAGGMDTVKLGFGIEPAEVDLYRYGNDLAIRNRGTGEEIIVREHFGSYVDGNTRAAIERIAFADGTIWGAEAIASRVASMNGNQVTEGGDTIAGGEWNDYLSGMGGNDTISGGYGDDSLWGDSGNDRLFGGYQNDSIHGGEGSDVLAGGAGNDWLYGELGNDTYLFNLGDGTDVIYDSVADGERNQVVFGEGVRFQDLQASHDYGSGELRIEVGNYGDQLRLAGASLDPYSPHPVDSFRLADGTVATFDALIGYGVYRQGGNDMDGLFGTQYADGLYGGRGDDVFFADSGNDFLGGGQGNDWLDGDTGDDTYLYNIGDGVDFIDDYANPGEGNRVLFGAGIGLDDVHLVFDGWSAHLQIGTNGDAIGFSNFYPLDPQAPHSVDVFEFADGSTLSYQELIARGFYVGGTDGGEWLEGSALNDRIYGYGGDDWLVGRDGNDTLVGGTGNDRLDGGFGNDTYVFAAGDGFDLIEEGTHFWGPNGPEAGGMDTVKLLDGYDPATTELYRYGNDLAIRSPMGEEIIVREHFGSYVDGSTRSMIEQISFADGTVWNVAAINSRIASFNSNSPTDGGDTIGGTPSADYIDAMGGSDTVSGGAGDDVLDGGTGNDHLFGGAGNDLIAGNVGNDLLAGGTGNDMLDGGAGNDVYLFNRGDGQDRIEGTSAFGETDRVIFGDGIAYTDLSVVPDYYGTGGVTIAVGGNGDQLHLTGSSPDPYGPHAVSTFHFADGTIATYDALMGYGVFLQGDVWNDWLSGSYYADSLYGNGGDDTLYGDSGNDILVGGQGNDMLSGGAGDDTYVYNRGDGVDYIDDYAFAPFEGNRVAFGEGITADDLRLRSDGWSARIEIAGVPGDVLQFSNLFPLDPLAPRSVETFEFADGSTLSLDALIARGFYLGGTEWGDYLIGSPYNDRIYGYGGDDWLQGLAGNDTLIGGSGFDQLDGGSGNDTYMFAPGDGFDMIWEGSGTPEAGGIDTVKLLDGYDPAMTELYRYGNDLAIRNGATGEQIIVREHFGSDVDGSRRASIEQIAFADGTIWDAVAISARIDSMNSNMTTEGHDAVGGTPWDDFLFGYGGNDTLSGGAGNDLLDGAASNDRLFGGAGDDRLWDMGGGNDLLAGGTGNDFLSGGAGHDTYRFNLGDGVDRIEEVPIAGDTNRVQFGEGIGFADLRVSMDNSFGGVAIDIGNGGDRLELAGSWPDPYSPQPVATFEFSDGTVATFDALVGFGLYVKGESWDEWLGGSYYADSIYGNGGNDYIDGFEGNDILSGGAGDDQLSGGWGNDSLVGGDGNDLLAGGDGDDVLAGGAGNDQLLGGVGNDTYRFGIGDGVDSISDVAYQIEGNQVVFEPGITAADLRLSYSVNTLEIAVGTSGDVLRLENFSSVDPYGQHAVENFVFADGSSLSYSQLIDRGFDIAGTGDDDILNGTNAVDRIQGGSGADLISGYSGDDVLQGGDGDDYLFGDEGSDVLDGGAGHDQLDGGTGADTLIGNDGDDVYLVDERADVVIEAVGRGFDMILSSVTYRSPDNVERLMLLGSESIDAYGNDGGESIFGNNGDNRIDGGVGDDDLDGGAGADELIGGDGDDVLIGGAGDDMLAGGWGNDTYLFNLGDGVDSIGDVTFEGDRVVFGEGIAAADVWLTLDGSNVVLVVGSAGDALVLGNVDRLDPYGKHPVETFEFADGSMLSHVEVVDRGFVISGSAGNGELKGTNATDYLYGGDDHETLWGLGGNDVLYGRTGDDILLGDWGSDMLIGGPGSDHLEGGTGSDTYVFNIGDGRDVVYEYDFQSYPREENRLVFGEGIGIADLRLRAPGDIAYLEIGILGDYVELLNFSAWDSTAFRSISTFELADGTHFTADEFVAAVNEAPVVGRVLADQIATEDSPWGLRIPFGTLMDPNGGPLTYSATLADGTPLPPWLYFSGEDPDLAFYALPKNADVGTVAIRITATDSLGASGWTDFNLTVENVNDPPTVKNPLADVTATQDIAFSCTVPADAFADIDVGEVLSLSSTRADGSALPAWLSFDPATRTFTGTPANDDVESFVVRVTATDSSGLSASDEFILDVANVNDAPVVNIALPDQAAAEGEAFSHQIAAGAVSDVDTGDTLTYGATLADGSDLPIWLSFDVATRTFSGNPADGTAGDYGIKVTATDSAGASVSDEFVLSVADSLATVFTGNLSANILNGTAFRDVLNGLGGNDTLYGYAGDDLLDGGSGSDAMHGGSGNDTYVVGGTGDVVVENANEGIDTVQSSISYTLGANVENLALTGTSNRNATGNSLDNVLTGNSAANTLTGNAGNDTLDGGAGTDSLRGGSGNDTYVFARGYGADTVSEYDVTAGNTDTVAMGVDALDVVFARSGSNLQMTLHSGTDKLTVSNWYSGSPYQTEVIETADGQQLLNTQVDQLIQAMAQFSASSGLTWDQALDQRPQEVQAVLAAYWQPAA